MTLDHNRPEGSQGIAIPASNRNVDNESESVPYYVCSEPEKMFPSHHRKKRLTQSMPDIEPVTKIKKDISDIDTVEFPFSLEDSFSGASASAQIPPEIAVESCSSYGSMGSDSHELGNSFFDRVCLGDGGYNSVKEEQNNDTSTVNPHVVKPDSVPNEIKKRENDFRKHRANSEFSELQVASSDLLGKEKKCEIDPKSVVAAVVDGTDLPLPNKVDPKDISNFKVAIACAAA